MMHVDLVAFYERIFAFRQYHNWTFADLESLMPWEMDVMMSLLSNYIEKVEMDRKSALLNQ